MIVEDPAGATAEYYLADKSSRRLFALRPPRTGVRVAELSLADHVGSCVRIGGVIEAGRDLPTLSIGSMQIRGGAGFDEVVQAIRRHRCGSLFSRRTTFSVELWHHDYFTSSAPFEVRAEDGRRSYVVSMVRGADDSCSYRLLGVRQHAGRRAFLEVCSGSGD